MTQEDIKRKVMEEYKIVRKDHYIPLRKEHPNATPRVAKLSDILTLAIQKTTEEIFGEIFDEFTEHEITDFDGENLIRIWYMTPDKYKQLRSKYLKGREM